METKYYHKNSDVVAFERVEKVNGFWVEYTYNERGDQLTYKNSDGYFEIKGIEVTEEEFKEFISNKNRPCVGKKVMVDGVEYTLK